MFNNGIMFMKESPEVALNYRCKFKVRSSNIKKYSEIFDGARTSFALNPNDGD